MELLLIIVIMFVVFGLSFLLLNIRHIVTGQEFRGSCASNNPLVKDRFGSCTTCGAKVGDACLKEDGQTPLPLPGEGVRA